MSAITAPLRTRAGQASSPGKLWLRALALTAPIGRNPARILATVIEEWAKKSPNAPALISAGESMTYAALAERSNRYTRWAIHQGLGKGGTVCLMMPNRPEYMAVWLGIARAGCTVALLNTNLTGASLAHSINIVAAGHIIVDGKLIDRFSSLPELRGEPAIWIHGSRDRRYRSFDQEIERYSADRLRDIELPPVTVDDRALCIYTSGTTGLPKAANVSHGRVMQWSLWFAGMLETTPRDRLYNCLPMYHSAGGVLATGAVLASGGSVVIRENFSAGRFWGDVARYDCTLFQYIGELCRYLLHTAAKPIETQHRLRACCGNGLRADIWDAFQSRFRVPRIFEFYAATEGTLSLFNAEGKSGSIGRIPPYLAHRFPAALVRFDSDTGRPARDQEGFCVACAPGETGEAIAPISQDSAANRFEGYTSPNDSAGKILSGVFARGDAWFRTGDLMRQDEHGYFYFVDRIGDTFRWKGENVSTGEVEALLGEMPGVKFASVYGVSIPGGDGRAGMAALVADDDFDLAAFRSHLTRRLPAYARPLFLRILPELAITATFKVAKHVLAREGYDPSATSDVIYFNHRELGAFVRVTPELCRRLQGFATNPGEIKL